MKLYHAMAIGRVADDGQTAIIGPSMYVGFDETKSWEKFVRYFGIEELESHAAESFLQISRLAGYHVVRFQIPLEQLQIEGHLQR